MAKGMAELKAPPAEAGTGGGPLVQQPERLKARLKEVPSEPGCYLMRDGDDRILYIGKAKVFDISYQASRLQTNPTDKP